MRLRIEPSSGVPISRQIADQIRWQCVAGALKAGDRVPSVREMARDLAVNQNTILHVYERLTAEGWLETRQGSGTFVKANPAGGQKNAQTQALLAQLRQAAQQAALLGFSPKELHKLLDQSVNLELELEPVRRTA
ncbi:MAG: GntR family transcriptional regulator [Phycisphaerae bacterium]